MGRRRRRRAPADAGCALHCRLVCSCWNKFVKNQVYAGTQVLSPFFLRAGVRYGVSTPSPPHTSMIEACITTKGECVAVVNNGIKGEGDDQRKMLLAGAGAMMRGSEGLDHCHTCALRAPGRGAEGGMGARSRSV